MPLVLNLFLRKSQQTLQLNYAVLISFPRGKEKLGSHLTLLSAAVAVYPPCRV